MKKGKGLSWRKRRWRRSRRWRPARRSDRTRRIIPEVLDWSDARRGVFYRPVKRQITLRLDADDVAWFKAHAHGGRGYQTALCEHVQHHES